jgi:hypothetical protein
MMRPLAAAIAAALALGACAGVEDRQQREEKQIVTGSNIPRKDRSDVTVVPKEALDEFQRSSGGPATRSAGGPAMQ